MARLALLLVAVAVLLLAGLSVLWQRSLRALDREQETGHFVVAQRLIHECERHLTELVEREDARRFDQYRPYYVAEDLVPGSVALNRSPLMQAPAEPWNGGYFQIEPDGTASSPRQIVAEAGRGSIAGNEVEQFLDQVEGWFALPEAAPTPRQAKTKVRQVASSDQPARQPPSPTADETDDNRLAQQADMVPVELQFGDFYGKRVGRTVTNQAASIPSLDNYRNPDGNVVVDSLQFNNDLVLQNASRDDASSAAAALSQEDQPVPGADEDRQVPDPQAGGSAPSAPSPTQNKFTAMRDAAANLALFDREAVVEPLHGRRLDERHLALTRQVHLDGERYEQGLVLDVADLVADLETRILDGSELFGVVRLSWAWHGQAFADPPAAHIYAWEHRCTEPFDGVALRASMPVLPDKVPAGRWELNAFAVAAAAAVVLGFLSIYRMAAARLRYAQRRGDFVAAVSHELKTPLTAIRMYGEMLREDMITDEATRQRYYHTITAEGERLSRLIDNVLELSRLEKGNRAMHLVTGSVAAVVDEVLVMLEPHARQQGFALRLDADADLPAVRYDRDALLQVLVNLVDNCLKFARNGNPREVVIMLRRAADGVALAVRDHGPGVPERHLARLFEPFYRGERELTRTTKGTGIGLALARSLIERMGGRLHARNHPGGGFEVGLRLRAGAAAVSG